MTEIVTPSGTIEVLHQITLGDIALCTVGGLLLIAFTLRWILDTIWGGRR